MPAQCIDSTQFHAGYGLLSAEWFAILKSFFTNNEPSLLNKSRRAKVYRTLLMHWFVNFFVKGRLLGARTFRKFFLAAIVTRVWEWSGNGSNTRLRTRLGVLGFQRQI